MRVARVVLNLIMWPLALALALAGASGAVAAQWGRVSLDYDVLAHFAPVWLAACAAALVLGFLFKGWWRGAVWAPALAGVAASAVLILPEFVRDVGPRARADAPGQVKVVQFNVWHHNPDPEAVLRWLDAENPDIAVISENSAPFAAALKAHPRWIVSCGRCEVLLLSRRAPLAAEPARRRRGSEHVAPLTTAVFADARGPFTVIGVHNAWPTDADQPMQEARLAEAIAEAPRERLIVAGDFNSTPWSFARRRWDKAFGLPRRERAVATWPARRYHRLRWLGAPFLAIDHIYAGPGWATVETHRGPRLSSDHYPLVVTLAPTLPAPR